jgi:uncharacterized protein
MVTFGGLTLRVRSITLRINLVRTGPCMPTAILILHLHLPGCSSLKEKRGRIKPILARLHREFNVSAAELDLQDIWQDTIIGCATISSDAVQNQRLLQQVVAFTEQNWPDIELIDHKIEVV